MPPGLHQSSLLILFAVLHYKGEHGTFTVVYHILSNTAGQYVCKTCTAMCRQCDHVRVYTFSKVNDTFFLGDIIEHIDCIIFQLKFLREIVHIFFHHGITLKIAGRIHAHEVNGGII